MGKSLESLTAKLVSIPSVYPEEIKLQKYIATFFLKKGFTIKTQRVEGKRANIIVEKGGGNKTIILYSHLDTVPPAAGWKNNPYAPKVKGDRLYGLGSYDMKGGMAVNIDTFLHYQPKNITLQLLFCVDEEYISQGGYIFANSSFMKNVAAVLSPEPAFAHGENGIVTGRIGRAVFIIRLSRPSQHFYYYRPEEDITIIASRIISRLQELYHEKKDRKEFVFVRSISTQAIGMSTPEEIVLELDASIIPPHTPKTFLTKLKQIVKEVLGEDKLTRCRVDLKKRRTPFLTGYELQKNDPYLKIMKETIEQVTGKKAVSYFRSSVADENIFGSAGKSVLGVGPMGGGAHSPQEWVSLSSLNRLRQIYQGFLNRIDALSS